MKLAENIWQTGFRLTQRPRLRKVTYGAYQLLNFGLRLNPIQVYSKRVRSLRYLNVGCGMRPHKGFINLDYAWYPGVDLMRDVRKGLPFPADTLRGIFIEHCLEHLPMKLVSQYLLGEFCRVLGSDGTLRIIVPDGGLYLTLYSEAASGKPVTFPWTDKSFLTPMMYVNNCFRGYGHLYAYDYETLKAFLLASGFKTVARRAFHEGHDPHLLIDDQGRACESLYVEARKK